MCGHELVLNAVHSQHIKGHGEKPSSVQGDLSLKELTSLIISSLLWMLENSVTSSKYILIFHYL